MAAAHVILTLVQLGFVFPMVFGLLLDPVQVTTHPTVAPGTSIQYFILVVIF